MAAKINESLTYTDADVEKVYGIITDQEFRSESCANQGSDDYEVTVDEKGDGAVVTVVRSQDAQVPDFVKKITGDKVKIKQTEEWSGPDSDGNRTADVRVKIIGQPAEMTGKASLKNGEGGTKFEVTGEVTVKMPIIGKKIEPEVAKAIVASLHEEVEYGLTKL